MNSKPGREPRADTRDIHQPKETHKKGVCYLALTFGTLLSSQGTDAHKTRPSRPSFAAVSPRYTEFRSSRTSGVRPAVSQALRPGPFSLGAGRTIHALGRSCTGGMGPFPASPEAPRRRSGDHCFNASLGSDHPGSAVPRITEPGGTSQLVLQP